MRRTIAWSLSLMLCAAAFGGPTVAAPPAPASRTLSSIDLSSAFGARPGWRFTASQSPDVPDPIGDTNDIVPGAIRLCLSPDGGRTCGTSLDRLLADADPDDLFAQPHFLIAARIVHPRPGQPLLLIQAASLHSINGDQRVGTVLLAYDRAHDRFAPAYEIQTGRNNNQETRYMEAGPLRGAIVDARPTSNAPFGFWISVSKPTPGGRYELLLRYRSATIYGDGNPLAVIDSDMPNLQRRLGLWRPGMPLPLPAGRCPAPHLIKQELWCGHKPASR